MNSSSISPPRSIAVALALLAATFSLLPAATRAQDYPSQDIRLICGFPPGSGADIFVRYFAEKLRPIAGRTVVVENKVGANSNIATEYVARSKPDGYTLYPFAGTTVAASMHLFKNPPVDVGKALRVAANPARIMGAIYKDKAGLEAVEVQYRTAADTLNEMANGKLDYGLHDPIFALGQQREGRLRVLAVSSAQRSGLLPGTPTVAESAIPGFEYTFWNGLWAPAGTPAAVVQKVSGDLARVVAAPDVRERLATLGAEPMSMTPEQFTRFVRAEIEDAARIARAAGIRLQ